jgi:putative chitinase
MYIDRSVILASLSVTKFKSHKPDLSLIDGFCKAINEKAEQYGVDTPEELSVFVGQCIEETGGFRYAGEAAYMMPPKYSLDAKLRYLKSKSYYPYYGRGPIQITGNDKDRGYNYKVISLEMFGDERLVHNPDILLDPYFGTWASLVWWKKRGVGLSAAAQKLDVKKVTLLVNGPKAKADTIASRKQLTAAVVSTFKKHELNVTYKGDNKPRKQTLWQYLSIFSDYVRQ